jgi:hypothetical protein
MDEIIGASSGVKGLNPVQGVIEENSSYFALIN